MPNLKRSFAALIIFGYAVIFSSGNIAAAAVTKLAIPQIKFVSAPVKKYLGGDRIKFDIQSPGYSGSVEYRVVLWEDAKKKPTGIYGTQVMDIPPAFTQSGGQLEEVP